MTPTPVARARALAARSLAVPLLALALLISGCSAAAPDVEPPADEPDVAASPAADEVVGPEQCLIGTWKIDNASFESFMNGFLIGNPAGVSMTVTGGSYMRFDDAGAYFSWKEDFTFTTASGEHVVTHVSNSGETGVYGVALGAGKSYVHDFLWVAETMSVVHDEVMTVGGVAQVIDRGAETVTMNFFDGYSGEVPVIEHRESVEGSTPFWCDGDLLKLEVDLGTEMLLHRTDGV